MGDRGTSPEIAAECALPLRWVRRVLERGDPALRRSRARGRVVWVLCEESEREKA